MCVLLATSAARGPVTPQTVFFFIIQPLESPNRTLQPKKTQVEQKTSPVKRSRVKGS